MLLGSIWNAIALHGKMERDPLVQFSSVFQAKKSKCYWAMVEKYIGKKSPISNGKLCQIIWYEMFPVHSFMDNRDSSLRWIRAFLCSVLLWRKHWKHDCKHIFSTFLFWRLGREQSGVSYNTQRLQKLIYLHLSTDYFMKISLQLMGPQSMAPSVPWMDWREIFMKQSVDKCR